MVVALVLAVFEAVIIIITILTITTIRMEMEVLIHAVPVDILVTIHHLTFDCFAMTGWLQIEEIEVDLVVVVPAFPHRIMRAILVVRSFLIFQIQLNISHFLQIAIIATKLDI